MKNQPIVFKITSSLIKIFFIISAALTTVFLIIFCLGAVSPDVTAMIFEGLGHQWNHKYFEIYFDRSAAADDPLTLFLMQMSLSFIKIAAAAAVLFILMKIFKKLDSENYFDSANIKFIRLIGYTVIISSILISFLANFYTKYLIDSINSVSIAASYSFSFEWEGVLAGLIILCISVIYQKGSMLQQESDYTV